MENASQKSRLRSQITIFKWIGGISALVALISLILMSSFLLKMTDPQSSGSLVRGFTITEKEVFN